MILQNPTRHFGLIIHSIDPPWPRCEPQDQEHHEAAPGQAHAPQGWRVQDPRTWRLPGDGRVIAPCRGEQPRAHGWAQHLSPPPHVWKRRATWDSPQTWQEARPGARMQLQCSRWEKQCRSHTVWAQNQGLWMKFSKILGCKGTSLSAWACLKQLTMAIRQKFKFCRHTMIWNPSISEARITRIGYLQFGPTKWKGLRAFAAKQSVNKNIGSYHAFVQTF